MTWSQEELPPNKEFVVSVSVQKDRVIIRLLDMKDKSAVSTVTYAAITEDNQLIKFKTPDKGLVVQFAKENYQSRIFEEAVASYLETRYKYYTAVHIKPAYLNGKEIDVFAEKGVMPKDITICECKLRTNDSLVTMDELKKFAEIIPSIKENESKRGQITLYFWFVTNANKHEKGVKEYAKNNGIVLMKARLSSNWKERADWSVEEINSF